jgi:thioredoxin-like negative regulator of GroEL
VIEQILQADRYLQVDQVEKAREAYQRVVDLDPGNSIAVVGLARCALADGDDRRAHELAARALEIDPENDMARRMETRLSEIMATRGEPVARPGAATAPGGREMRPSIADEVASGPPAPADPAPADPAPADPSPAGSGSAPERKSLFDRLLGR